MKKSIISVFLILAILALPLEVRSSQEPKPKPDAAAVAVGCMVIIIGVVVVVGLVMICKKIPDPGAPPPKPPPTPTVPTNKPPTNPTVKPKQRLILPNTTVYAVLETNANGTVRSGWSMLVIAVQATTNLSSPWQSQNFVTNWIGPDNQVVSVLADAAGRPLQTNWTIAERTNAVNVDFYGPAEVEPQKFYRMELLP